MALVRVAIPHFCRETDQRVGYGSTRAGARMRRCVALARCLGSLLALRRHASASIYSVNGRDPLTPVIPQPVVGQRFDTLSIDIHLFVNDDDYLDDLVQLFVPGITLHRLNLDNPLFLAAEARDWLIQTADAADLFVYSEDDLVFSDPLIMDKWFWFLSRTDHQAILMPHRYEIDYTCRLGQLYVDGPLRSTLVSAYYQPGERMAYGQFAGDASIYFDLASNPHAGCFAISSSQRTVLQDTILPRNGFIGPLETAATLTVLQHWPIWKPSWTNASFLEIEHAHPSFLSQARRLSQLT